MPHRSQPGKLGRCGVTSIEYALIAAVMVLATLAAAPIGTWILQPLTSLAQTLSR
jgi:Flp pilus assembly pilin Flp